MKTARLMKASSRGRDRKKNDATKAADIELVRYRNAALPDIAALAARFAPRPQAALPTTVTDGTGRREPPPISTTF